jgi:hypothetical protein
MHIYVCRPLIPGVLHAAFVDAGSNGQDPAATIRQIF